MTNQAPPAHVAGIEGNGCRAACRRHRGASPPTTRMMSKHAGAGSAGGRLAGAVIAAMTTMTMTTTMMMASSETGADGGGGITGEQVEAFAKLALAGIDREYPNKPGHVMTGPESIRSPRELHPVFYGHFDWHSSVHGHWMLVRLLRLFPGTSSAAEIRETLDRRFTPDGLRAEAEYFDVEENRSFERMYGWGWALRLGIELRAFAGSDADAARWAESYRPLEERIVALASGYLPKLEWPIRCGFHPETAFPLGQMLDHARAVGDTEFAALVAGKAEGFYGDDRDYPVAYEPSGNDFFSAGLNEADLMRRVLPADAFSRWLDGFFPGLRDGALGNLLEPVGVSDPADGHLVHLAGLNLNRAWTMRGIASALPGGDPRRTVLETAAARHAEAGLGYVSSGHYEGDHWLASFAVYLTTGVGVEPRPR